MTYYMCNDCGNRKTFTAHYDVTEYNTENNTIDGEGDIIDYGDSECNDSETNNGPYDIKCDECDSEDIFECEDEDELELAHKKIIETQVINDWEKVVGK